MLEVKNLCKTYKTKKGAQTRALDDVSICFPETGLVFLLGKSGSGKSTLLNICGGLDTADAGEIVIMGKSSRDFSPTDFDSYRNTFIGFVFQEYNILGEFTVEDNIALALELQNKKRDPAKVAQILQSVDLAEFAGRRPNTLSGGQKQRVAIARALVKEPRIILADEPTGALDSDTGRQVLETLKKLSADKLVVVVSHDREFAEQYADRIVELKDGKIISDVTRAGESGSQPNVCFFEDTVAVRDCAALTDEDFAAIRRFLSSSKSGAMLSCNRAEVAKAQSAAPDAAGKFEQTKRRPAERSYTADEQKMIRSHLPFRHAFRMGASCVRTHPVRLAFSIFLCLVAFVMFGIFSTVMFYDEQRAARDALGESNAVYLSYYKAFRATTEYYSNGEFTYSSSYINPYTEEYGLPLLELHSLADTQKVAALGQGEIALSLQKYAEVLGRALDCAVSDKYESAMQGGTEEEIAEATACNEEYHADGGVRSVLDDLSRGYTETGETGENGLPVLRAFTMEEIAADLAKVTAFMQKYSLEMPAFSVSASYSSAELNVQCTAFFYEPSGGLNDCSYVSQDVFATLIGWQSLNTTKIVTNYDFPKDAFISGVFVPDFRTNGALETLTAQTFAMAADDSTALIDNVEMHDAQRTSETVAWMRWFFFGVGLGLTLFAILLMFNFISASIAAKKKEIGILRAIGARATDVYKVFFSEALIVAAACFVLAVIACAVLAPVISSLLIESTLLTIKLLRFGPLSVLFMAAVALFTAAVSTLVPVAVYSRKPPVESIRAL